MQGLKQPTGDQARQIGRNVAQAINTPIADVAYAGERCGVECPVCHANILHVRPEGAPPEEEE